MNGSKNVISTFSGAMGLDNGVEKAGLSIRLCVEFEHAMAETIRANRPGLPLIEDDIRNYSGDDLRAKLSIYYSKRQRKSRNRYPRPSILLQILKSVQL